MTNGEAGCAIRSERGQALIELVSGRRRRTPAMANKDIGSAKQSNR